ncbi:MAG TPA: HAMP domain-containing sensor histidine kinase, partial [Gemmataceae bacterium]|nr:HAMP domain-containing sensor histidine kinase [Gemmataceae bacterium]
MTTTARRKGFWRYLRGLWAPALLWILFVALLVDAWQSRIQGDEEFGKAALREWVEESRVFRSTLPELVRAYLAAAASDKDSSELLLLREEIQVQLNSMADPTKILGGQLPLFPAIYRVELDFSNDRNPFLPPIIWESGIPRPRQKGQVRLVEHPMLGSGDARAVFRIEYQLHAYNKRQRDEQSATTRLRWVLGLAAVATALAFLWIYLVQRREQEREQRRRQDQLKIDQAKRQQEEAERKLLEQRLATQAAEQQALELKSQLYASIGIMAGSYAHNIKNLLVRPNDLLRRCLEEDGLKGEQEHMLREVRLTLGTVTERLQQILQTVRRDPSRSEMTRFNLVPTVDEIYRNWKDLAREKWKLTLTRETGPEPLWIQGDISHLQQAIENLVFNARDATFEMRNHLREEARRSEKEEVQDRRQALIAAAAWKGVVILRTYQQGTHAILEIQDNGIGMTEEVRCRCTETHFSTKRNNAVYEGNTTGMG